MKNMTNYTINHEDNTITMSGEFAKLANIINSDEYKALVQFRNDFPLYAIKTKEIAKTTCKTTHKDLTLDRMKQCIESQDNAAAALIEFESVKNWYKGQSGYYAKVKRWFLDKYPNYDIYKPEKPADAQDEEVSPLAPAEPAPAQIENTTPLDKAA
jgi:hypothetical protein